MPTVTIRPVANGDVIQQRPNDSATNYENVDEVTADGDTTFNDNPDSTYTTRDDLYQLEDISLPEGAVINSVTVYYVARNIVSGYGHSYALIKTHDTVYRGSVHDPPDSYRTYSQVYTTNPYTGNPWTVEEVNALQAGTRLTTEYYSAIGAYTGGRVTQVYVVVDYSIPTVAHRFQGDGLTLIVS